MPKWAHLAPPLPLFPHLRLGVSTVTTNRQSRELREFGGCRGAPLSSSHCRCGQRRRLVNDGLSFTSPGVKRLGPLTCNTVRPRQSMPLRRRARQADWPGCIRSGDCHGYANACQDSLVLCLSICGMRVMALTQAALLLQSQMKL